MPDIDDTIALTMAVSDLTGIVDGLLDKVSALEAAVNCSRIQNSSTGAANSQTFLDSSAKPIDLAAVKADERNSTLDDVAAMVRRSFPTHWLADTFAERVEEMKVDAQQSEPRRSVRVGEANPKAGEA